MKETKLFAKLAANVNRIVDIAYDLGLTEYYISDMILDAFKNKRKEESVMFNDMVIKGSIFRKKVRKLNMSSL